MKRMFMMIAWGFVVALGTPFLVLVAWLCRKFGWTGVGGIFAICFLVWICGHRVH